MLKSIKRRRLYITTVTVGVLLLSFHYLVVVLQLLPANPVTILNSKPISSYVDPFFEQNWRMFAPDPPLVNRTLLIQMNVQSHKTNTNELSEWFDVSSKHVNKIRSNPFSSAVTRYRTIDGILSSYLRVIAKTTVDSTYEYSAADWHTTRLTNRLLETLAHDLYDPNFYTLVSVRGRILFEEIPPFSKFQEKNYKTEVLNAVTTNWFSVNTMNENE